MTNAYLYRTQAGAIFHNEIKQKRNRIKDTEGKRKAKTNPTREAVINENNNISAKQLAILLDANFKDGDYHVTLTYRNPCPTHAEAKSFLNAFIKAMRREYKKQGKTFKWVSIPSRGGHRVHHHMVISAIDADLIVKHWKHGFISASPLSGNDYTPLAWYFINHTRDYYDRETHLYGRRYSCSRNLERPDTEREDYQYKPSEEVEPARGCYIIPGSVNIRVNPITGTEHITYRERRYPEEALKKYRKQNKRRIVKPQRHYKVPAEEQEHIPLYAYLPCSE